MEHGSKKTTAEIRVHISGEIIDLAGIGIQTRQDLEQLKQNVEAQKVEIRCLLPRTFRDAVTMETVYDGLVVFAIPEAVAREYSLID